MLKTPPIQTATATIDTLCGRLQSATLLEDRRAAILGLRSFAKQYPASVASGSLRELINTLRRDGLGDTSSPGKTKDGEAQGGVEGGDIDTIRLVLETLLMLFKPDSSSPEAGDEIAFFMADEFSMRQDNANMLLSLLDPTSPYADYYSRLYSVQLLSAICAARPERLQECVLGAPLGVSRLVGILDDSRDAVRNAGLLLLVDLTGGANEDLRKIVAFEDVFGKAFALIRMEGGLADAGIAAQDCLSLLANMIQGSGSNQTMFRESGCVKQLVQLLQEVFPPSEPEPRYTAESREKAGWGVLQLLKLFFEPGEASTPPNQQAFFRAGAAQVLSDLGFHPELPIPVRIAASKTAAALIQGNAQLQEAFAGLQIVLPSALPQQTTPTSQTNGSRSATTSARNSARTSTERPRTYIIEALLDLVLEQTRIETPLRAAGCSLLQAYLTGHERIKAHFLQRAIAGHKEGEDAANVLTTLLDPESDAISVVFASRVVQDLVNDLPQAKAALASVKEGDESEGEDVLTAVQALGSQLQSTLQTNGDERLIMAYASLLSVLLWEFADGINDLLGEGSSLLQAIVESVKRALAEPMIAGLVATLLGIIYEFSTKDSPIPRRTLAPLLTKKLGRAKYLDALLQLRRHPLVRDFGLDADDEPTELSSTFVDLFMNEYNRLRHAIDKDPGVEVLFSSTVEAGVDRDILDELRDQLQTTKDALAQAQQEAVDHGQRTEQDRLTLQKEVQTAAAEVDRLRRINQAVQQGHEEDVQQLQRQHTKVVEGMNIDHSRAMASTRQEAERQARAVLEQKDIEIGNRMQDHERRYAELGNAHRSEQAGHANARRELEVLGQKHDELNAHQKHAAQELRGLIDRHTNLEKAHQQLQASAEHSSSELEIAQKSLERREAELTASQLRVKELEEEVAAKEEELKTERSGFADLEKELEAAKATSTEASTASADLEAAIAKSEKLEQLSKSLAAEISKLKGEREDLNKRLEKAEAAADKVEAEANDARESEKGTKEELESLLLVLGEIEGKRDEYKAKVKELGGEVSEDEDEDDDEDEDEEGEGEVD